jgi:hypothetical protein
VSAPFVGADFQRHLDGEHEDASVAGIAGVRGSLNGLHELFDLRVRHHDFEFGLTTWS